MNPVLGQRYQLKTRLGAGGMGEVYHAYDPELDRPVAIKLLLPQFARDPGFVSRFRSEARAAAQQSLPIVLRWAIASTSLGTRASLRSATSTSNAWQISQLLLFVPLASSKFQTSAVHVPRSVSSSRTRIPPPLPLDGFRIYPRSWARV